MPLLRSLLPHLHTLAVDLREHVKVKSAEWQRTARCAGERHPSGRTFPGRAQVRLGWEGFTRHRSTFARQVPRDTLLELLGQPWLLQRPTNFLLDLRRRQPRLTGWWTCTRLSARPRRDRGPHRGVGRPHCRVG